MNLPLEKAYRALFYDSMDEYYEIIAGLTHIINNDSENGIAYNNRGLAYFEIGKNKKVLNDFKKAVKYLPIDPNPFLNMGDLFKKKKEIIIFL